MISPILLRIDDTLVNLVLTNLPITGGIVVLLCVTWLVRGWLADFKHRFGKVESELGKVESELGSIKMRLSNVELNQTAFKESLTSFDRRLTRVEDKLDTVILYLSGAKTPTGKD
ncbi:MAG TPA: hypothetical protein VK508_17695 [Cyclobacteriaceae bacterium]|nr:hypothetical protein [Cyclobacteriaceae bacterium]